MTRIVWVLLFQRWKAELSGDPLLRATVHGQWGVFFEGQQDEEGHPTAIVKVVTAGPCALIWLVGLRVFEQTTLFFLTSKHYCYSKADSAPQLPLSPSPAFARLQLLP